ncbi:MAG: endonuclease domain-containing protein [Parvibaculum sp.]|uniref:endonuclease domain-containing protein n=1 Tax=Parvibaculum sp. TaxID=2024848 RepID=UPI002840332E|nr:endonuclease domain-containing protein [Parvibaculum sp.]MDR3499005.1 endonuclease domain-containing protein [Parvibaculum sp.]
MTSRPKIKQARSLRRNQTDAERRLWSRLRNRGLSGFKFKRQIPIGPYIVDFLCEEAMLVVELDGGQHDERADRDALRTRYLEAQGYRVIRFWNNEALANTEGMLAMILGALGGERPSPNPLPRGEG